MVAIPPAPVYSSLFSHRWLAAASDISYTWQTSDITHVLQQQPTIHQMHPIRILPVACNCYYSGSRLDLILVSSPPCGCHFNMLVQIGTDNLPAVPVRGKHRLPLA